MHLAPFGVPLSFFIFFIFGVTFDKKEQSSKPSDVSFILKLRFVYSFQDGFDLCFCRIINSGYTQEC
jgi:hypothetical protein